MAIQIDFYHNSSDNYVVDKSISLQGSIQCTLKDDTSVEDPVILLTTSANISSYNYMWIPAFGRYYFINDVVSVHNNLWEVSAHVDVLMTYKSGIRSCTATCKRQENLYNKYLDDPEFKTYNNADIVTKPFSSGALNKNMQYVLVVAGG